MEVNMPINKKNTYTNDGAKSTKKTTKTVDNYTNPANEGMNLSGSNNIQNAVGNVKNQSERRSSTAGAPANNKPVKSDFTTSSVNKNAKVNTETVKKDLQKAQSTLSSMTDESNRKAQSFFNNVADTFRYDANSDFVPPQLKLAQQKVEADNARSTEILLGGGESKGYTLTDEDVNKLPSVLIDQRTGTEADQNYVGGLYDTVNNNYNYINGLIESLNNNYRRGLINEEDYKKTYSQYQKMWESNQKDVDELSNYQYLSGKDYYDWLKENGSEEEIKDFEALVGSYDDSVFESLLNQWKATQVNTINKPFQTYSMIRALIDENYDYNDPNNISSQLNEAAEELRSYAFNGKNGEGFRYYSLQTIGSLMPMINDAIIGSVAFSAMGFGGKALETAVGTFTNVEMGISSAEETFRQRLSEGNSVEVAFSNATAHGVVTAMVEALNMGNIGNVVSLFNGPAKHVLGVGLLSLPNFLQMAKNMSSDAFGEGMEEVYETLLTSLVDNATNVILSNFTDERVGVEPVVVGGVGDGGLTDQFIMASAGAVLLGLQTNAKITVDSIKKYNAGGQAIQYWQQAGEFHRSIGEIENAEMCDAFIDVIAQERQTYYDNSIVKNAVQTAEDIASPAPSVDDVMNMIANGFRADVSNQFEVNDKQRREGLNILNRLETEFNNRGYSNKMNFESYIESTPEVRDASKKIMNFADAIGANLRITDEFMYAKNGELNDVQMRNNQNGVTVMGDTIVVNPFASEFLQDGGGRAMLNTFSHELTHTTERTGAYKDLKEAVRNALGNEWESQYETLKTLYEKNGQFLNREGVEKEIVAKYIENNISNEQFLQRISDYNDSLFTKIYTGMRAMLSIDPNARVAQDFFRAYSERINSAMNSSVPTNVFGDMISANDCQFNVAQYNEKGKYVLRNYLDKQVNKGAMTREDADSIIETLDFYYDKISELTSNPELGYDNFSNWSNVSMTRDHEGFPQLTCVVANGDYKMNIDFSTVCKKRKVADAVFNEIAREGLLDKRALSETDIATIRNIVKRNGLEVACSLCFVDSKRFKQGGWAETLVNGKEDKIDKKLVSLGVQNKQGHVMGWNEMVDVLANDPSEIGDFNFANRQSTNEGTLHTLSDSELNQKGLRFLRKVAKNTSSQSEVGKIARALLNNPELRKHMLLGDLYASEAFGNIKRGNQDLFKIVNTHQGVAKPKSPYVEVTYNNEIITSPTFDSEKARNVGGVRIQSFSDYMSNMVFDYMEMVAELQAKGLTAHSYTKVQDFAELFGNTGIKINLSIIPKATTLSPQELNSLSDVEKAEVKQYAGLERFSIEDVQNMSPSEREALINERGLSLSEDGSCYTAYIFEDESFNWLDALELQNREGYDKNVGTICVGVSDEHILKMMNDDNVKMIIPYHKSSLNPMVAHMMNISAYNDYTDSQNTRVLKNGEWVSIGSTKESDFSFYSDVNGMINNGYDAKATSRAYLNWCAENGHLPKFDQFAYIEDANGDWVQNENGSYSYVGEGNGNLSVNDNYYKVLIDFRAYDNNGNLTPQETVRQSYPEDFMDKLKASLTTYEELTNKQKSLLPKVVSQVREELQNNDIQNSFSDVELSDEYDIAVRNNDTRRAESIVRQYAQNYARENGQQVFEGFHGTNAKFNKFLKSKLGSKNFLADSAYKAFFMAGSEDTARNYTGLNQADMFQLNFDENMQGERQRIMEKYDLENLRNQRNEERTNYINNALENLISQDTPIGRNGLPDVTANMIKRLRENGVDGFTAEQISNLENSLRDQWLAENNDIYREYESNSELYKRLEEAERQATKEYEQLGIDYLGYEPNIKHLFAFMSNPLVHDFKNEGRDVDFTALIDEAKENGNDGVIFKNVKDGGDFDTIYAVFEPNQFKSADAITYDDNGNVIPLSERFNQGTDDLRYSISDIDNDGNKLSRQQREFFKYSKVVDENGNLLKVYHGTNADFTMFDPRKFGKNGNIAEGFGIYLTDNKDVAKAYGNKLMEAYANITNPASSNSKTIDVRTLERLIERTVEKEAEQMVADGYDSLEEAKKDSWISNYVYTHDKSMSENYRETAEKVLSLNDNDMDIIREVMNGMGIRDYAEAYEFYDALKETTGIDGFETIWENSENPNQPIKIFVALDSSQIKNVNNTNPTSSPDIQYDITDSDETVNDNSEQQVEDNILNVLDTDVPITTKSPSTGDFSSNKIAQVLSERPTAETTKERWERIKRIAKHEIIDHLDAVRELARRFKNPQINAKADFAMLAPNMAYETIMNRRTKLGTNDVIGKSLNEIYGKLPQDQKQLFDEYMYHWRNVDSTSVEDRLGGDYKNKYVFGENVGTDDSLERIAEIEREHPEYKQIAEDIWEYTRQNLQMLVDGGIISKQQYDNFQKATPHYVPISRNVDGGTGVSSTDPNKAIKRFKGSSIDILPLEGSLIKQTQNIYRSVLSNSLHNEILDTLGNASNVGAEEIETVLGDGFNPLEADPKGGKRLYAYRNGQKYSIPINDDLYNSLSPRKNPYNLPDSKILQGVSEFRRNLITGWNPLFMITNAVKDVQDAGFNTKYPRQFLPNFMEAWAQILSNGEYKQLYLANGGGGNTYINELGDAKLKGNNPFSKAFNAVVSANEAVEMAPRLAEFISTLRDGKSIEEAMYNASEITTNFKRGGDTAKYFNRNGMAFLNASIQGFDKQVRNIQEAKDGGARGMLTYMAKVALAGMPLYILNHLMWKDDDDYEELSDYVKDNYYIIKKYGDGKFIRIPKGRVAAFIQNVIQNGVDTAKGDAKIWDALVDDYMSFMDNVAPNNPIENFIATPLIDAMNNRAWYGGDLLPTRLQDVPDSEQYDESTDALSVAIGKLSKRVADATGMDFLEISPYKLNYVLDQYSGALGDIVLPMITPETTSDVNNPILKGVTAPVLDKFTTDSVLKNRNVTEFYTLRDEINKLANSVNATDEQILASKYLYSVSSEMGKLYAEKHRIQADTSLTNKEKYDQVREIQNQINELAKAGLANYDQIDITDKYASIGGVQYYKKSDGSWVKPSKSGLENASGLSAKDSSVYFETFGEITDIRSRIKSETPEGETANYTKATIDAISNSDMSYAGKNALYDSYYDSKVTNHINAMNLSDEQKYNLKVANKLAEGTKDENGKTVANSKAEAVADAYARLGLLNDVLKYIQDNNIAPSEMGLSKTVYNKLVGNTNYQGAYNKSFGGKPSSRSSKKASGGSVGSSTLSTKSVPNSTVSRQATPTNYNVDDFDANVANAYLNAYSNSMRGSQEVSTGGASVVCPNCRNRVTPYNGRCPICGNNL